MYLLNRKELSVSDLARDGVAVIEAAYAALDIEKLIARRVRVEGKVLHACDAAREHSIYLSQFERITLMGIGKGSYRAIRALKAVFGRRADRAVSYDVESNRVRFSRGVTAYWGSHPKPSEENVRITQELMRVVEGAGKKDLIIFFIGGGGSSLLCGSPEELRASASLFDELTRAGASIRELNTVRKHISVVKGGNLARLTHPAQSVSLIVSDVCGNDMGNIASGPTVYDATSIEDALVVLKKYKIPYEGELYETPKDRSLFTKARALMLACNEDGMGAMLAEARRLGYRAHIADSALEGEARDVLAYYARGMRPGEAVILGGETTVHVRGAGKGGRNQEAVLGAIAKHEDIGEGYFVASFGTDGRDNSDAAGACADLDLVGGQDREEIERALRENDSYKYFAKQGGHIFTRADSFNVSDLMLILRKK